MMENIHVDYILADIYNEIDKQEALGNNYCIVTLQCNPNWWNSIEERLSDDSSLSTISITKPKDAEDVINIYILFNSVNVSHSKPTIFSKLIYKFKKLLK